MVCTQPFQAYTTSMLEEKILVNELPELLNSCIKGNRQAHSKLYKIFANKMFAVCLRYGKNREEAEETLQEGFMKVFENLQQFNFAGSFEGWMRRIMVNCALQKYRSKPQLRAVVDIKGAEIANIGNEDIIAQIGNKELLNIVQQLPPAYKMVFNLYVFEGMKHREIAEQLNISEGTSKSNLSDARKLLQKAVNETLNYRKPNLNFL
jgi:RNA polymerase sigma factor (sigma-70 family)